MSQESAAILDLIRNQESQIHTGWLAAAAREGARSGAADRAESVQLLRVTSDALDTDADPAQFAASGWQGARDWLDALSRSSAAQGRTAAETSVFILSVKRPLFDALRQRHGADPEFLISAIWMLSTLVDQMAGWTVASYQRSREDIIRRQQEELLELSTPVIKLWDGILAVPMIGTLDSARTQLVMEALLQRLVDTGSHVAIIDITGVPTVDTLVAQHLLKTVSAIRLMGAECIISGIRPQIAQTIVHLGIEMEGIATMANLSDALALALRRLGLRVTH
jgi:rsbT co-antagonist protein RsbR